MDPQLLKAQDMLLGKVNQICGDFGLNNVMAQLYTILYFNGKSMSLDEMADRLKISKGSVSVNIRALERYGAVRQIWVKGTRKDYYEAEADITKVITDRIRSMVSRRLSEVDSIVAASSVFLDSIGSHNGSDEESVRIFKERLNKLKSIHKKAKSMFDLFNATLGSKILP